MGASVEPSHLFLGDHSTNHKIRWNQEFPIPNFWILPQKSNFATEPEKQLKAIYTPTLLMPGNNDIHPRRVAEQVHRLIPNARWAEVRPHAEEPEQYVDRVLQFLAGVEANA